MVLIYYVCFVKRFLSYFAIVALTLFAVQSARATHNRAGEITYRQTGPLSVEMTIITYTKASSVAADRDSLDVFWGDGTRQFVKRDNNRTKFEPNDIKINYYIAEHTYPGPATYTISFQDPNRIGGILNVNYPNSIDIPFFLSTTFTLLDQQFQGLNNSAVLLQPPIDIGCVNKIFVHNPNAYDPDGDSLAYELTAPLQAVNTPVPGYKHPDEIGTSAGNSFTINPLTGEVRWNSPKLQGEYNIAIKIKEYRNGKLINVILRDMQILIRACDNEPPVIKAEESFCVIAGETIVVDIEVDDPNQNQKVKLSATGGPFTVAGPAQLIGPAQYTPVKFTAKLVWQTNCQHVSDQYYQVVLRAVDNFYADSSGLAALKTIRIKVVGPPPQNLTAKSQNGNVLLEWDQPYRCDATAGNYFQGFSVWRKISSANFMPDTCNPGLTGSPYVKIVAKTTASQGGKYFYEDTKADPGYTYCYRVQAEFAKQTLTGNPFNRVESLPSDEVCLVLLRDLPLITKTSVDVTSVTAGEVHVRWTRPLPADLDTIQNPGPYTYELWRSAGMSGFVLVNSQQTPYFSSNIDTNYFDKSLNTLQKQYSYFIRLFSKAKKVGDCPAATTLFLTASPQDKKVLLTWSASVPWSNQSFDIFRRDDTGNFVMIGRTTESEFTDSGLDNEKEYCYKVFSTGTYSIDNIEDPITNYSQETCLRPYDNEPPCTPAITVKNICDQLTGETNPNELYNIVNWAVPGCPGIPDDIKSYNIYYSETTEGSFSAIANVSASETSYLHYPENGILGCYHVTAIDENGNESPAGTPVCVDNCPNYILPNTFTPNGDGKNDIYKPRLNLFIESVEFKVFNQWGNEVFSTKDPDINWNGTTNSGKELSDGTYYYTCLVFEKRVTGTRQAKNPLTGFIHIIRN